MNQKYYTARSVLRFILVVGWLTFGIGIVGILLGVSKMSSYSGLDLIGGVGLMGGISAALAGLIQVAISLVAFAVLDMADASRRSLALQAKMAEAAGVEVSASEVTEKPAGKLEGLLSEVWSNSSTVSKPEARSATNGPSGDKGIWHYKGETIEKVGSRYHWGDDVFSTLGKAKSSIAAAKG